MKSFFYISTLFSLLISFPLFAQNKTAPVDFYNLSYKRLSGEVIKFDQFKGKKVLIVNTASKCGYTGQYEKLQQLYEKYSNRLVIIGFPSNDFGAQEPGSNEEIALFCKENYGVSFIMMEKSSVKGKEKNSVFQWLTSASKNGWNNTEPSWNFWKYLVDEHGNLIAFFPSKVDPMSKEITDKLDTK